MTSTSWIVTRAPERQGWPCFGYGYGGTWLLAVLLGITSAAHVMASDAGDAAAGQHAVILLYHHVSDETPPSTSVSPGVFSSHLDYLAAQGFNVIDLDTLLAGLQGQETLPAKAVAITFDDAYASVYANALPLLEQRQWPFTVFASTDYIDKAYGGYMSWPQLRAIEERGGRIGNHSSSHRHLVRRSPGETDSAWRDRIAADIEHAQGRLQAELDAPLRMHAYPYGEFDGALESLLAELGYPAFGQQSGPVGPGTGIQAIPRFPVAAGYAQLETLAEKLRSRPLIVEVISPDSRVIEPGSNAPVLELKIRPGAYEKKDLRCYVSAQQPAHVTWHGDIAKIRARQALQPGRSKFNCTVQAKDSPSVYYWYSYLWIRPNDDGSWYRD